MKSIAKVWTFGSTSNAAKTYQTLLYSDFTLSCDCPGWTRRTDSNGDRTCRHVRSAQMGRADAEALSFHSPNINVPIPVAKRPSGSDHRPATPPRPFQRKLCLK